MSNLYQRIANNFQSASVLFMFMVFLGFFGVGAYLSVEDFATSKAGWDALPTADMFAATAYVVGLIPQLGQIGFGYLWASDTSKKHYLIFAVGLHILDVGTDMVFRAWGMPVWGWFIAWLQSELVFTLGSEIMLVLGFGMVTTLLPQFIVEAIGIIVACKQMGWSALVDLGVIGGSVGGYRPSAPAPVFRPPTAVVPPLPASAPARHQFANENRKKGGKGQHRPGEGYHFEPFRNEEG